MTFNQKLLPLNFAGLESRLSSWENASVVVLPVPYDLTTSYLPGTRRGPLAIIEASTHLELFDEELKTEIAEIGIHTLDQVEPVSSSPEQMIEEIENIVTTILESNKFPLILGGEHSISLGSVRAFKKTNRIFSVIQFDAHADLRDTYQRSKYNHACVARRISEICDIAQIGIRSISSEEYEFQKETKIDTYFAKDISGEKLWIDSLIEDTSDNIYITIDLDVFDPSIMPSVGTPEPGGLTWYEIMNVLKILSINKNIIGFDVVELCPQPTNIAPDYIAAKLCYKLLGFINCSKK